MIMLLKSVPLAAINKTRRHPWVGTQVQTPNPSAPFKTPQFKIERQNTRAKKLIENLNRLSSFCNWTNELILIVFLENIVF